MLAKSIDFTQPGGAPMTQNRFAYLQTAWSEIIEQLVGLGVNGGAPTVLSGMVGSVAGGTTTVSAGWFVYNGQIAQFTGDVTGMTATAQTYTTAVGAGNAVYVVVTTNSAAMPVPYNNGSTPSVVNAVTGVLTVLPNTTPIDATHFLLSSIVPWQPLQGTFTISAATAPTIITRDGSSNNTYFSSANALNNASIFVEPYGTGPLIGQESVFISSITAGNQVTVQPGANTVVNITTSITYITYTATNSTYCIIRLKYLGTSAGIFYYSCEFLNPSV